MTKYIFPPEAFAPPYKTIPITKLCEVLASKNLGRAWPPLPPRPTKGKRRPAGKRQVRVLARCDKSLLDDLRSGALITHAYVEPTGHFRRIPPEFWLEEHSGLCMDGTMQSLNTGANYREEIEGADVLVLDAHATGWLAMHGIDETNQFFPNYLRSQLPSSNTARKTQYDWPAFEAEALEVLHENGAFAYDWIQARLEELMRSWCTLNWGAEPAEKLVRDHVRSAYLRFQQEKKGILGRLAG